MADVKDILGIRGGAATERVRSSSKAAAPKKPDGVSREVFALTGGGTEAPIVPSNLQGLKEKRKTKTKVSWKWTRFSNSGRTDNLELFHWVKKKDRNGQAPKLDSEDYQFAKYNKKIQMLMYDDEEYTELLAGDPDWTRGETDYLFELCQRFDLRFIVVADRYTWEGGRARTVEDLKDRYYSIARKLLIAREGSEEAVANHPVIKDGFNAEHEVQRKKALEVVLLRSAAHEREESQVLEEAARIEEARAREAEEQRKASGGLASAPRVDLSALPMELMEGVGPSLFDPRGACAKPAPGVYARGVHTVAQADAATKDMPGGQRVQKRVVTMLEELGIKPPTMPTKAVCGMYLQLRRDIMDLLEVRKRMAGPGGATPTGGPSAGGSPLTPSDEAAWGAGGAQKARTPRDGVTSPGVGGAGGDGGVGVRAGKRDNKRKAPARYEDSVFTGTGGPSPRGGDKRQRVKKNMDD